MIKELPLFPLNLVAFPGEKLNLHIFEDRYKSLINDCVSKSISFGIPPYDEQSKMKIGTEMKILDITNTYEDGRMDIKTLGIGTFNILDFFPEIEGKLYSGGRVKEFDQDYGTDLILQNDVLRLVEELYLIMKIDKSIPDVSPKFHIFSIAHKIGLNIKQEITLLSIDNEIERLHYVKLHLNHLIPVVKEMESLREKIQMNGHFKNVIPPKL